MTRLISSGGVPVDVPDEKVDRLLAHGFVRAPAAEKSAESSRPAARPRTPRRRASTVAKDDEE